jgi:hypothetical protein
MTLTIQIPDEEAIALTAKASAQGVSAQQYAQQILLRDLEQQSARRPRSAPLSSKIGVLWSHMPADVRAKLPTDGASQIDHYVYGHPKRDQ